jgi:translation initiation factor 1 (eIF-1/SUI1)
MNKTIPFILGTDFVSIVFKNQPVTIYKNDARFHRVLTCIKCSDWKDLESALSTAKTLAKYSAGNIAVFENTITFKGQPVNNAVTDRIFEFIREQLPFEPLVNFLNNLMENPSERSRNQLYTYMEKYKLPVTPEGDFLAVKAVEKDTFLDKYTRTIRNKVGDNPKMDRKDCVEDENIGCGASFHCGNYNYVSTYGQSDDEAVLVQVNPKDVVSCPKDCSYQKLRVCEYKVILHLGKVQNLNEFNGNFAPKTEQAKPLFEELAKESTKITVKKIKEKFKPKQVTIGADKAYEIVKAGGRVSSGNNVVSKPAPRAYFRQHSNWKQV